MQFGVLGSGSAGNAYLVKSATTCLLIDAGLSGKQLQERIATLHDEKIDAVLLTHEHGDHIRGLKMFLKKHQVPVYCTASTAHIVKESGLSATWQTFEAGQTFQIGDVSVQSFSIPHDAVDPVGYVVSCGEKSWGIMSDLGHVTQNVIARVKGVQGVFLEANYDDDLLLSDTKRPWSIKQRISSRHGHLSNKQAAELIEKIVHHQMQHIILGHLSSDCNAPEKAISLIRTVIPQYQHITVECACQHETKGWYVI